jgi:sialidase-1
MTAAQMNLPQHSKRLLMAVLATLPFAPSGLAAERTAPAGLHAWYHDDGVKANGPDVSAWENALTNGAARNLSRVVGRPQAMRVNTASGPRTVVRFNGSSALWQASGAWGSLGDGRTVVALVRLTSGNDGVLFDGSTMSGMTRMQLVRGHWNVGVALKAQGEDQTGASTHPAKVGEWQVHSVVFKKHAELTTRYVHRVGGEEKSLHSGVAAPLGGFILGANVAANRGLACDVAEVLVFDRALEGELLAGVEKDLAARWGTPVDFPADQQPQVARLPEDPRLFRTTIRRRGDDGVHTFRIPGLATTPKGTLIAVFDARNKGGGDLPGDIDVAMMRSTDDGATWSPMRRIMDHDAGVPGSRGNGVGDPAVLVDHRAGTIFVAALWSKGARAWNGSGPGMTPEETGQFVLVKSTDDGVTWSAPINITAQVKDPKWRLCFNGPGNGIQLRDGTLVFPAQFKGADNVPHSCFIASRDGGVTWKISPAAIPGVPPTSESAIAEIADGSLVLSMRNEARAGLRAWARWEWRDDLAQGKWSEPWFAVPDPTCMASLIRHPHGELILSNPNHTSRRVALTIRSSNDGGRTWSAGRLLDPGVAMYSSLTVLRDGRIGVLYESGDVAGLVFARFPIEWVLEGAGAPNVPEARLERTGKFGWWPARHEAKVAETRAGGAEIIFLGDSITQNWETAGRAAWEKHFAPRKAANYGFGGDSTQHVLWRVRNGEFDGASPKAIVLLIGTNNARHGDATPEQITAGVRAILDALAEKCPRSKVLLLGILPRGAEANDPWRRKCEAVNTLLPALADGQRVHFLNANAKFVSADGALSKDIAPDLLHLSAKGYSIFAAALEPKLAELLGGR